MKTLIVTSCNCDGCPGSLWHLWEQYVKAILVNGYELLQIIEI